MPGNAASTSGWRVAPLPAAAVACRDSETKRSSGREGKREGRKEGGRRNLPELNCFVMLLSGD
jgi:hypothetical protein